MGRTAQPAALKLLKGTRPGRDSGGRRVNLGPGFVRDAPDPPTWLGREAKAEWRRIVPELERLRLVSRVTRGSLAVYCETWQMFVEATRTLHAEGLTIEAKQGRLAHPAVAIARTAGAELRRWAQEYGLTPVAEQKVWAAPSSPDPEDDLD